MPAEPLRHIQDDAGESGHFGHDSWHSHSHRLEPRKILIVDDQPELRELVGITLGGRSYKILYAGNGPEALDVCRREGPDVVILDIHLSTEMDGYAVCEAIKSSPDLAESRVIMLTSMGGDEDRQLGLSKGADDYFVKPFSPLELLDKIDEVLR